MANDTLRDIELNRFWNDFVAGEAGEGGSIDAELAGAIRRLHVMAKTPPPEPARERVRRGMSLDSVWSSPNQEVSLNGSQPLRLPASTAVPVPARVGRTRWATNRAGGFSMPIATVVVLLVTLFFGYLVFRESRESSIAVPPTSPTAVPPATTDDWPMFRGNAARTGATDSPGPKTQPAELWRFKAGDGVHGAPVLVGGKLIVPSDDGNLYALDASTGSVIWQTALGSPSRSTVTAADGLVFVNTVGGDLFAVRIENGEIAWKGVAMGFTDPGPVVNGVLFAGGVDYDVHALDAQTGNERWSAFPGTGGVLSSASYDNDLVIVPNRNAEIVALDPATGQQRWHAIYPSGGVGAAAVSNGVVYYATRAGGNQNRMAALDANTGNTLWMFMSARGGSLRPPAVGDSSVYVAAGDGNLYALDRATGDTLWSFAAGAPISAAPVLAAGIVYFISSDGVAHAVDAATGTEVWSLACGCLSDGGPVISKGVMYLAMQDGSVLALAALTDVSPRGDWPMYRGNAGRTGATDSPGPKTRPAELWRFETGGSIYGTPVLVGNKLIVSSGDGNLYALDRDSGQVNWTVPLGGASWTSAMADGGLIFASSESGDLVAVRIESGEVVWKRAGMRLSNPGPVVNGVLYVGDSDGNLYAFDRESGADLWSESLGAGGALKVPSYENGVLIVPNAAVGLLSIDPATGEQRWVERYSDRSASAAVADGVVYAVHSGEGTAWLEALNADTGKLLWRSGFSPAGSVRSPALSDSLAFVATSHGTLYALDRTSGDTRWSFEAGTPIGPPPVFADGLLYFVTSDGTAHAVEAASGRELWSIACACQSNGGFVAGGGLLFIANADGTVVAFAGTPVVQQLDGEPAALALSASDRPAPASLYAWLQAFQFGGRVEPVDFRRVLPEA